MLVEAAIGDAYAVLFESGQHNVPWDFIREHNHPQRGYAPRHWRFHTGPNRIDPGTYSDDTQQHIVIASHLANDRPFTREAIADRLVKIFKQDPRGGYSREMQRMLSESENGADFLRKIDERMFRGKVIGAGSIGNGSLMRAACTGVLESVDEIVRLSFHHSRVTHDTEITNYAAAATALATHFFLYDIGPKRDLGEYLNDHMLTPWIGPWNGPVPVRGAPTIDAIIGLVMAHNSMTELLKACVDRGGDTDSVASAALAIASCSREYRNDLPQKLYDDLENGRFGHDFLQNLDETLLDMVGERDIDFIRDRYASRPNKVNRVVLAVPIRENPSTPGSEYVGFVLVRGDDGAYALPELAKIEEQLGVRIDGDDLLRGVRYDENGVEQRIYFARRVFPNGRTLSLGEGVQNLGFFDTGLYVPAGSYGSRRQDKKPKKNSIPFDALADHVRYAVPRFVHGMKNRSRVIPVTHGAQVSSQNPNDYAAFFRHMRQLSRG